MAVADEVCRTEFVGNESSSTPYAIPWRFDDESWLVVDVLDSEGNLTTLQYGDDYSVGGDGSTETGNVTTAAAVPTTSEVFIYRQTPQDQTANFVYQGKLVPSRLIAAFDKLTMIAQDLRQGAASALSRFLRVPDGEEIDELASATDRAEKILWFDEDGQPAYKTADEILAESGGAPTGIGIPVGGSAYQALKKTSGTDYAVDWGYTRPRYFTDKCGGVRSFMRSCERGDSGEIAFYGDSLFVSQGGIPYTTATYCAAQFPNSRVEYRLPNAGSTWMDMTLIQAGPLGERHWYFPTGTLFGVAMNQNSARATPAGAAQIIYEAFIALDAVSGSGWPLVNVTMNGFGSGSQRSEFILNTSGQLVLTFFNGTTFTNFPASTSTIPAMTAGVKVGYRVVAIPDNGSAQKTVQYFRSTNNGETWTQINALQTEAGATAIAVPTSDYFYWIGSWGNTPAAGLKIFAAQIYVGTTPESILPHVIECYRPGAATTIPTLGGSPTIYVTSYSKSGGGITVSTDWLVGVDADDLPQNAYRLIFDRNTRVNVLSSSHNDEVSGDYAWAAGADAVKATVATRYKKAPSWVIKTQNPEPLVYAQAPQHNARQSFIMSYAASAGDACFDSYQAYIDYPDYQNVLINTIADVHPTVAGYAYEASVWQTDALREYRF